MKILRNVWWVLFFTLIVGWVSAMSFTVHHVITTPDDPPKSKKEIKQDTTRIDLKQMKEKNLNAEQQIRLLDSLIMQIDTLKKKK